MLINSDKIKRDLMETSIKQKQISERKVDFKTDESPELLDIICKRELKAFVDEIKDKK
jgi:hypothetical protein